MSIQNMQILLGLLNFNNSRPFEFAVTLLIPGCARIIRESKPSKW